MILAQLMRLDGPDGIIRMSTLPFDWVDGAGVTWIGGGGILAISPRGSTAAIDGGSMSITWSGASLALLAEAQKAGIIRSKFRMVTIWLDDSQNPPVQSGAEFEVWAGLCETPEIDTDPSGPTITLTVQSPLLDLSRIRPRRLRGAENMRDINPDAT